MSIQGCMSTRAAAQLSAHRSRRPPGLAIMRRLACGLALPSLAGAHPSSGGAPQHGGEAFLRHAERRTFFYLYDDSIYKYDHSAILDPIVNGTAAASPCSIGQAHSGGFSPAAVPRYCPTGPTTPMRDRGEPEEDPAFWHLMMIRARLIPCAAAWAPGEDNQDMFWAWLEDCVPYILATLHLPQYDHLFLEASEDTTDALRHRTAVDMCEDIWHRAGPDRQRINRNLTRIQSSREYATRYFGLLLEYQGARATLVGPEAFMAPLPPYLSRAHALLPRGLPPPDHDAMAYLADVILHQPPDMLPLVEAELAAAPMDATDQAADDPVSWLLQHIAASDIGNTSMDSFHASEDSQDGIDTQDRDDTIPLGNSAQSDRDSEPHSGLAPWQRSAPHTSDQADPSARPNDAEGVTAADVTSHSTASPAHARPCSGGFSPAAPLARPGHPQTAGGDNVTDSNPSAIDHWQADIDNDPNR